MGSPDPELVHRAVAGDRDALSLLLREHGPAVEKRLQIGSKWQALVEPADVMQITYIEAFGRIGGFDPARAASFPAWLRQAAENNLRDAIRGLQAQKQPQPEKRVHAAGYDNSASFLLELMGGTSNTPSRQVGRDETDTRLNAAIARLPRDYSTVVRMYDLEGASVSEVATALGRSPGAVHMLRARAHDRLRELLGRGSAFLSTSA